MPHILEKVFMLKGRLSLSPFQLATGEFTWLLNSADWLAQFQAFLSEVWKMWAP